MNEQTVAQIESDHLTLRWVPCVSTCKAHERFKSIPVMIIAEITEPGLPEKSLEMGAIDFLSRPLNKLNLEFHLRNFFSIYRSKSVSKTVTYKILLENENTTIHDKLKSHFAKDGSIVVAGSRTKTYDLLSSEHFDIVITDISNSEESSFTLLRAIKKDHPKTKTILLTDEESPEIAIEAHQANVSVLLKKPLHLQLVNIALEKLRKTIEIETLLDEASQRSLESEKMATVGTMSATFAHEIANPMGVISGNTHILKSLVDKRIEKKPPTSRWIIYC